MKLTWKSPTVPFRSFSLFSRTAVRVTHFPNAVDLARFTGISYSSADIAFSMITILFLQRFEDFFGFIHLFAM